MIFLNRIHYIVPRKATPSKIILWFFNSVAVCFFINLKILPLKQFNFLVSSLEGAYHYFYRSFFSLRIVFGGIEELGWRYSFQPSLEKKISYIASTLITFVCWAVWHLLFFYIDGSLGTIHVLGFLLGLLTNSFILSALFAYSNSLWICVMTHALINTFSQMSINDNVLLDYIAKAICIFFAVYLYHVSKKKRTIDK